MKINRFLGNHTPQTTIIFDHDNDTITNGETSTCGWPRAFPRPPHKLPGDFLDSPTPRWSHRNSEMKDPFMAGVSVHREVHSVVTSRLCRHHEIYKMPPGYDSDKSLYGWLFTIITDSCETLTIVSGGMRLWPYSYLRRVHICMHGFCLFSFNKRWNSSREQIHNNQLGCGRHGRGKYNLGIDTTMTYMKEWAVEEIPHNNSQQFERWWIKLSRIPNGQKDWEVG